MKQRGLGYAIGSALGRPLASAATEGRGSGWAGALPALRTFVTANYNQPNPHNQSAMASPPTITATSGAQASVPNEFTYPTDTLVQYGGGFARANASNLAQFPVASQAASGGNISGTGLNGVTWRARAKCTSSVVGIRMGGSTTIPYRFIVDGKYVDTTGTLSASSGSIRHFLLDFGSSAQRTIEVEGEQNLTYLAFCLPNGSTYAAVGTTPKRMIILGDSFIAGTGTTRRADNLGVVAGDMLGIWDTWCSGVGGTGYVATNSGTRYKLSERLADANTHGPWDAIVVAMGINDKGTADATITAEVSTCLSSLRSNNPSAQIFVVGPWDHLAPAAPLSDYTSCKAAILAGIPSGSGFTFLDPTGVTYTKSDTLHPDVAGHDTLGKWLALQIKTALGA